MAVTSAKHSEHDTEHSEHDTERSEHDTETACFVICAILNH